MTTEDAHDKWYCQMWMEIVKLYGYPVYRENDVGDPEQEMGFHGMVMAIDALERLREVWIDWCLEDVPVTPQLAEDFSRIYYELEGGHPIPSFWMPGANQ